MKNIVYLLILIGLYFTQSTVKAQQQPIYTQYMFNGLVINPAYTGSHEALSFTTLARKQWVGLEGAPNTQTFSVHSPIRNKNIALGFTALRDQIGVSTQYGAYFTYAYRIHVGANGIFSLGIQGGVDHFKAGYSKLNNYGNSGPGFDPHLQGSDISLMKPNFGAGMYYYTNHWFAGLSVPNLLTTTINDIEGEPMVKQVKHYFFTTGLIFNLGYNLKFKPSTLIRYVEDSQVEFDINTNFLISDILWLGASYRSFESVDAIVEFQLSSKLKIGYAYDFLIDPSLRDTSSGSHELLINYRFSFSKDRIVTPRYF
ncbi:PorP/SprF family type IX secretion system membrane protein [Chondrinema litorale]|uniref:PorP/SprF family type IX secretion system membrane protein n=1 Tax=Chondrinema litorale TaxID=2994555 RepID=UPI002542E46C|nr:type IX secretion system membrane protein PorP/SprF [Chondrinema litorale]UZR96956.1 type IX secretion system membrane protein PorP/SprF [Chondrinema litorale]